MSLHILPTLDSREMAGKCRRDLDIARDLAAEWGRSAVEAARAGVYRNAAGDKVLWRELVARALATRVSIPPDQPFPPGTPVVYPVTRIQIS
jgi:hypothetical protein